MRHKAHTCLTMVPSIPGKTLTGIVIYQVYALPATSTVDKSTIINVYNHKHRHGEKVNMYTIIT